jgi:hypothetical protein
VNPGYRRAALALSALSRADRAWILENLSSEERAPLAALLADLEKQGIKVPASELGSFLESNVPSDAETARPMIPLTSKQRLAQMSAAQVFRVLAREPDWLVAIVCGIAKWRWLREFLSMLEDQRASRVQQYIRSQVIDNAAVCEALVTAVVERSTRADGEEAFELEADLFKRRQRQSTLSRFTSWLL